MLNPIRLGGPIFEFELLTTSRRGRYFAVRSAYAAILLLIVWQIDLYWISEFGRELTPTLATRLALTIFGAIMVGQELLVMALTPALVSGVIASEKQRKTLHYLMASSLGGFEIVFGKLLSRMLHIGVFLAVSFPITSLLVLMGGVDPRLVLLCTAWTASTAFFLCSLSVFVSVYSKTTREALFLAYMLELLWLVLPEILRSVVAPIWPEFYDWFEPWNNWLLAATPFSILYTRLLSPFGPFSLVEDLAWMMGMQVGVGLLLAIIAAVRLRAVYRAHSDAPKRSFVQLLSATGRTRWLSRPACGEAPVAWKERHTSRQTRLMRIVGMLATLTIGLPLLYYTYIHGGAAFVEAFGPEGTQDYWLARQQRYEFEIFLQAVIPGLFMIGMIGVAASASASITCEHEDDTWTSLTATDLTAREIVFGKMFGSMRLGLKFLAISVILASLGAISDSLHPLTPLLLAVVGLTYISFAAAFGTWISMFLKSTWRAQFLTMALLFLISLLGQTTLNLSRSYAPMLWPGFYPADIFKTLLGPHSLQQALQSSFYWSDLSFDRLGDNSPSMIVLSIISVLTYGALAIVLTSQALKGFDRAAGRAKRTKLPMQEPALAA